MTRKKIVGKSVVRAQAGFLFGMAILAGLLAVASTPVFASPTTEVEGITGNDSRANANNVDAFFSDQSANPNIFINDTNNSAAPTFPSVSVTGTLGDVVGLDNDDTDFYSFTGVSGRVAYFDIDNGTGTGVETLDPYLSLFDSNGTLLAYSDDNAGDPGSINANHPFIGNYTLPADGTYYAVVSGFPVLPTQVSNPSLTFTTLTRPDGSDGGFSVTGADFGDDSFDRTSGLTDSGSYTLNISMQNAAPAAVPEPGTMSLLGIGLVGLVASRRRRKKDKNDEALVS